MDNVVVVDVKSNGPGRDHYAVEVAWWHLGTGDSGVFVPPHSTEHTREVGDRLTLNRIGYDLRLYHAPHDTHDVEAHRLADALDGQILAALDPLRVDRLLADSYRHVRMRTGRQASWSAVFDIRSYAAGVLTPFDECGDLAWLCGLLRVEWLRERTAAGDVHAVGECLLALVARQEEHHERLKASGFVTGFDILRRARRRVTTSR